MDKKKRKNCFEECRLSARKAASEGLGIDACPYKRKSPHQAVWLAVFSREAQLDWVG